MKYAFFVSGIGTDVGKTVVSSVLCELLFANYWKPVQSGELGNTDSMKVERLVSFETFNYFPEQFRLTQPLSPHVSAKLDGVHIETTDFTFPEFTGNLIVEGAGGLMVPVNENGLLYCDLAAEWKLPTILISRHYLGNINHTLMSIEILRSRNIPILGIIYVGDELPMTEDIIFTKTQIPTLFHVPIIENLSKETISTFATQLRTPETLAKFGL
jgi:dethiobiotin synthetase